MSDVAVCVPWRDPGCSHRRAAWTWCRERWAALHPEWPVYVGTCDGPWSVTRALNDAIDQADAKVVVLAGADTAMNWEDVTRAAKAAESGAWVVAAATMLRLDEHATLNTLYQSPGVFLDPAMSGKRVQTSTKGYGPIVAPLDVLREVRYDNRFAGWGCEDEAWVLAARTLVGEPYKVRRTAFLLWHPPAGPEHPNYDANFGLLERYHAAAVARDREAMRRLVNEGAIRPKGVAA